MAPQPIINLLKVRYERLKDNGGTEFVEEDLRNLIDMKDDTPEVLKEKAEKRSKIVSLAVLPLYTVEGKLSEQADNVVRFIKGFPILQKLAISSQFEELKNTESIRNQDNPSLQVIGRIRSSEDEMQPVEGVKGIINGVVREEPTVQDIEMFGTDLIGGANTLYSVIELSPRRAKKSSSASKSKINFITNQNVMDAIKGLTDRLDAIERKVNDGKNSQLTKTKITNILNKFVGKITQEQLDSIISEIRTHIDVNISVETMESLQENVDAAIKKSFAQIHAQIQGQENEKYKTLLREIAEIKQNTADASQAQAKVLALLQGKLPDLIATNRTLTDKIFMRLGELESEFDGEKEDGLRNAVDGANSRLDDLLTRVNSSNSHLNDIDAQSRRTNSRISRINDNLDKFLPLIMEEFQKVGGDIASLNTAMNSSDEELKKFISQALTTLGATISQEIQNGNNEFFERIGRSISSIPTVENIRTIAMESMQAFAGFSYELQQVFADQIVDRVISQMGDVSRLDDNDLKNVKNVVTNVISSDRFRSVVQTIIQDENLAKETSIEEIKTILGKSEKYKTVFDAFDDISSKLDNLANKEDIENLISRGEDGEYHGWIVDFLREELTKREFLTKADVGNLSQVIFNQEFRNMFTDVSRVMTLIEQNGGVVNNVTNNTYNTTTSDNSNATNTSDTSNSQTSQNVFNVDINTIKQMVQNVISSSINNYIVNNVLAQQYLSQNAGMGFVAQPSYQIVQPAFVQPAYQLISPLILGALAGNQLQLGQNQSNIDITQIQNLLSIVLKNFGVVSQPNSEVDNLRKELEDLKKKQQQDVDELKKMIEELMKEIKKLKQPTPTPTPTPTPPEPDPKPTPKPTPKPIELPKPVGKSKLIAGTIKHLKKLKEPKLPLGKRIRKFIVRHPLRAAAIGVGIGVLGAAGVALGASLITTGGIAAALNTANSFLPTIGIGAAIGAGVPLIGGAIGAIVSANSRKGKKERLYTKFLKQKAKCDELAEDIEKKYEQAKEREQKLQEARENMRNGNKILKKLGVYKIARNHNRKKLRKLTKQARVLENKHSSKVSQALGTKQDLNAMEERDNKSMALGGDLQKLRNKKAEIRNQLASGRLSDEEKADLIEELNNVIEDAEDQHEGISQVSEEYETFDREAEELINSVKGEKSEAMKDLLENIESRNSKKALYVIGEKPKYDSAEVVEYLKNAKESKSKEDHENAGKFQEYLEKLQAERNDIDTLLAEGKIDPATAEELERKGFAEVQSGETVGIDFKEANDEQEKH